MFFMYVPILPKKSKDELTEFENNEKNQNNPEPLITLLQENINCEEIKLQLENNEIKKIITTKKISTSGYTNIEQQCRKYANQDILIKIRNGKKIVIEITRIISV